MADISVPTSALSSSQLKWSYFYVTNKIWLRRILITLLVSGNLFLWGYSIAWLSVYLIEYQELSDWSYKMLHSASTAQATMEAARPQALATTEVIALPTDLGKADLLAQISNPNNSWLATFDYGFVGGSATTTFYPGYALPGSSKYLTEIGSAEASASLTVKNIKWQKIADFAKLKAQRDQFEVANSDFIPSTKEGNPSRAIFTLINHSPYGFWSGQVAVLLYSNGTLVGFSYFSFPNFKAGESRDFTVNWSKAYSDVTSLEIVPEVNFLDQSNLMPASSIN